MPRKLVWIKRQKLQGFGCSECNWVFKPSAAPLHKSLDEMKQKYEHRRDKAFNAHVCVKHPGESGSQRGNACSGHQLHITGKDLKTAEE
jgi:hypothetical protein